MSETGSKESNETISMEISKPGEPGESMCLRDMGCFGKSSVSYSSHFWRLFRTRDLHKSPLSLVLPRRGGGWSLDITMPITFVFSCSPLI